MMMRVSVVGRKCRIAGIMVIGTDENNVACQAKPRHATLFFVLTLRELDRQQAHEKPATA
jgi:hypothetical protein